MVLEEDTFKTRLFNTKTSVTMFNAKKLMYFYDICFPELQSTSSDVWILSLQITISPMVGVRERGQHKRGD